ncbi:hypothetical protein pdul_cds_981 [Pandoravirus dulcis]|uniref:Transmembrane protein n=1 Tax=Pandoravirus dulcis TaxID=1349409 RepID=S4VZF8_9VIRU|nr:hypothetical protein pdul_cds_981 [Pandoravirus dulcis]AGO83239.1 hypothetical protein pdul_cds_981 [Pandoravirus dulcis]
MDCTDRRVHNKNEPATVADDAIASKDDVPRPTAPPMRQRGLHDARPASKIGWREVAVLSALFVVWLAILSPLVYKPAPPQASSALASSPMPPPGMAWVALDDQPAHPSDLSVCRCPCQDSAGQAAKGHIARSRLRAHCVCRCALAMETSGPLPSPDHLLFACVGVFGLFFSIVVAVMHKCGL